MKRELKLPLTIEKQLESYYKNDNHTERHEILWHAWNQNKRWFNQLLQMTLTSFPTYSKHDESHASAVLHNIEMLLGEERIAQLSASDCFVLLHTVYIHDIGMCITYEDRANIVKNKDFLRMVDELEGEGDRALTRAIEALKQTDYSYDNEEDEVIKTQKLYEDKLQVYYALIHLIANYRRAEHGECARDRLYNWTLNPDKLGIGFSLSGIPLRIFLSIANSAQLHTNPKFEEILSLPQEDDGFALDYYHPRFISVLLQLGDILDMDNNRFHPLTKECMGSLPEISEQHYEKHLSIRRLHIRPDKISIEADCTTQEALRLVRKECDMLSHMLQVAGYYWSIICPADFIGALPTVEEVKLSLDGQRIPEELVTTQFKISQKKAFSLLEGANVYSGRFVFLREFLQNAVDATKMQYWNECCSTKGFYASTKSWRNATPNELNKKVSVENFPIEIEMEIQKRNRDGEILPIIKEDLELLDQGKSEYTYGVKVRVKDFGTGIDKDRILDISKVGNSRKAEKELIDKMPEWLRPTAEFGVGLQSAFLVTENFKCYTYTRTGQRYEISFGAVSNSYHEGYINVKPLEPSEEREDTFGSCFEVFVPCDKKFLHKDCYEAWNGEDAFDEYYECRRPLRHSAELLSQMALYLDEQVGELLFPVHLHIKTTEFVECSLNKLEKSKIRNIKLVPAEEEEKNEEISEPYIDEEGVRIDKNEIASKQVSEWGRGKLSWLYFIDKYMRSIPNKNCMGGMIDRLIYLFDYDSGELHIWDGDKSVFATVNSKNLIRLRNLENGAKRKQYSVPNGTKVYYKGIELEKRCIEEDSELIEYIDIEGTLKREHINLSRNGFTVEGERYFEEEIYHPILASVKRILKYLAQQCRDKRFDFPLWVGNNIEHKCKEIEEINILIEKLEMLSYKNTNNSNQDSYSSQIIEKEYERKELLRQLEEQIVSIVMLAYLAMREDYNQIGCAEDGDELENRCPWHITIQKISELLDTHYDVLKLLREESEFFNIIWYDETCNYQSGVGKDERTISERITFVDIFSPEYSYAIAQVRENEFRPWRQYLILLSSENDIVREISELQFIRAKNSRDEYTRKIKEWEKLILNNVGKNVKEYLLTQDDSKQQFITKWLLRSVPSVGIFTNESGDVRVNILSNKILPFLYVNENYKLLVMQRLIDTWRKDGIKRFSMFSWYSHMYLGCKEVPYNIFCVKRGYMGNFGINKTILPIGENELADISKILQANNDGIASKIQLLLEKIDIEEYVHLLERKYSNVKDGNQLSNKEQRCCQMISEIGGKLSSRTIVDAFCELIKNNIRIKCAEMKYEDWETIGTLENLVNLSERAEEWEDIFLDVIEAHCMFQKHQMAGIMQDEMIYSESMRAVVQRETFDLLCKACLCLSFNLLNFVNKKLQMPLIQKRYLNKIKTDKNLLEKQKRIYAYVSEHGSYDINLENLENCYLQFTKEIYELFQMLEVRKNLETLKGIRERKSLSVAMLEYIGDYMNHKKQEETI